MKDDPSADSSSAPLISIGVAIGVVLLVPVLLYSVGPEGPLKVGDVVFATDRYRVKFVDPQISHIEGYQDTCILESRVQLVVKTVTASSGSGLMAEPVGVDKIDPPYCPPRLLVFLHSYQATLKADLWGGLRDTLSNFFARQ